MTSIYHITHVDNLPAIIARGALLSDTIRSAAGIAPQAVAHAHIKDRRKTFAVPVPPGGVVADYAPFYFCPRSPMLFVLDRGGVAGYTGGQRPIVHLVAQAESVAAAATSFCFTDAHAVTLPTNYFTSLADLAKLPWDDIRAPQWGGAEHLDRKRRKQAEFLVHGGLPWNLVAEIGVIDQDVAARVAQHLAGAAHAPPVAIHRDWYY